MGRRSSGRGAALGVSPFGLDALELLRLEKGHLYLGQDTLPDDTPAKLGLGRAVDMTKPWFVGKAALERLAELPPTRRLAGLVFEGAPADGAELRGAPLTVGGAVVGRVTSARTLARRWIERSGSDGSGESEDGFPNELRRGNGASPASCPPRSTTREGTRVRG